MNTATSHFAIYQCILEPWTRLAMKSSNVVHMRLAAMPWLMLTDPLKATNELERMISEKNHAWAETVLALSQTPMQLWIDMMTGCWSSNPCHAFNTALINNSRRVAHPANRRVRANCRRLGRQD
ncbi:hypothetical protein ACUNV4_22870 [Granulosicoccus sp. 3-233]|uniref:hypothetical protein n=1 Tax=Granulosicoccus sp. 3-233 TaxID=3417969 RepID=UPI003D34D3C4